uniref:C3H1-type domain-containing protein n=1 Tax=Ciona savignyi TaxID=51511 RepID=H2ZMN7_CIOSA
MGKRYYCEYCDRAFQDNLAARKKHLTSGAHIKNRQAWYLEFRDKQSIYDESLVKKPCQRYLSSGNCQFGNQCKYRHFTEQELYQLKQEIENESSKNNPILPSNEEILTKWNTKRKNSKSDIKEKTVEDFTAWKVPKMLRSYEPLPPSLLPPVLYSEACECDSFTDWG